MKKGYTKNFIMMIAGQIISIFGSALLRFALSLYILDITGRADLFAGMFAISNIPILLSPVGGAIADRFNRRNLMVIFDFTSSVVVMCLFMLISVGFADVWLVGITMVLLSIISTFYTPAVTASIPLLVPTEKLESANGMVQAVQALSGIIAPILGGVLYSVMGMNFLVAISSIAFFLSAVMEMFIKIPYIKREWGAHIITTIASDMKDGFIYVIRQSLILKSMILASAVNFILTPLLLVGAPIILRVTLKSNDIIYGVGIGLISLATILGALTVGFFAKKMKMATIHYIVIIIAFLIVPIALSVLPSIIKIGYYQAFFLFMIGAVPMAMLAIVVAIFVIARVQRETSNENLGKVMAIIMAVAQCVAPLGQAITKLLCATVLSISTPDPVNTCFLAFTAIICEELLDNTASKNAMPSSGSIAIAPPCSRFSRLSLFLAAIPTLPQ